MIITLMMEAASTSEMSVNSYQTTWRYNPEDSHLYTHCCENLKFFVTLFEFKFSTVYCAVLHRIEPYVFP
jgi:hypothetical protein